MKNKNVYSNKEFLGAMIGGGAVFLILIYTALSWFGMVFQQSVIIPLIFLLAFILVLIFSYRDRLNTLNHNYCFDYINYIRDKKYKNTIVQSTIVFYIEQLIMEKRDDDALRLLLESRDILSSTDSELYFAILNKEYIKCSEFIDNYNPDSDLVKKRFDFWKKYCEIKSKTIVADECDKQINELYGESEYKKLINLNLKKRRSINICSIIIMSGFFIFGLYLLFSALFISPIGNDTDRVFAKAFGVNVSNTLELYDDGMDEESFKIYSSKDAVYYCHFEKKSGKYIIKHFFKRQKEFLKNSDSFDIEAMTVEVAMRKWEYDYSSTVFVMMDEVTDTKTSDNKEIRLENNVNGEEETFYIYSIKVN